MTNLGLLHTSQAWKFINQMEAYVSASIGIFDNFLKPMAWLVASPFIVPWIYNPSFVVKNIHPFQKIVRSTWGSFILPIQDLICPTLSVVSHLCSPVLGRHKWLCPFIQMSHWVNWLLDIDWAEDADKRQSTSGYWFLLGSGLIFLGSPLHLCKLNIVRISIRVDTKHWPS